MFKSHVKYILKNQHITTQKALHIRKNVSHWNQFLWKYLKVFCWTYLSITANEQAWCFMSVAKIFAKNLEPPTVEKAKWSSETISIILLQFSELCCWFLCGEHPSHSVFPQNIIKVCFISWEGKIKWWSTANTCLIASPI